MVNKAMKFYSTTLIMHTYQLTKIISETLPKNKKKYFDPYTLEKEVENKMNYEMWYIRILVFPLRFIQ